MKTTKKPGHLPTLSSSQTPREQHRPLSYYFKDELASLSEFEEHTKKLKTLPTERKHQEASPTLPNFFKNRNYSLADSVSYISQTPTHMTPKTIQKLNMNKKFERQDKVVLAEKIAELKHALQKYKTQENQDFLPSKAELKKTMLCLELLNETESHWNEAMDLVLRVLRGALYISPKLLEKHRDDLIDSENEDLRKMMLNCDQNYVPYYALCAALLTELTKKEGERINHTKDLEIQVKELSEALKIEKELSQDLQDKLSKAITREVYMQIIDELKGAKGRAAVFFEENKRLELQVNELIEENIHINKQYEDEAVEVDKRDKIIEDMKTEKQTIILNGEENITKISEIKKKFSSFNSYYDSFTIRLEDIRDKIASLQKLNKDLVGENSRLNASLSASGLEALTPRPDYRRLCDEGKIGFQVFDTFGRLQVVSTTAIVEELSNKANRGPDGELKEPPKIINPAISNIKKAGGSRSRAGSFNVANSPLKMGSKLGAGAGAGAGTVDSPTALSGKSSFGRTAARPSGFAGLNTPNAKPSIFGSNLSPPTSNFFTFQNASDSPESNSSSPRDDRSPTQNSVESSPTGYSEGTPKSVETNKFTLRIQVPQAKGRRDIREDVLDSVNQLLSYIGRTKDDAKEYVTNA